MKYSSVSRKIFMCFNIAILILLSLTCILPFLNLLAVSFSSSSAVASGQVVFWPVEFTTFSYRFALEGGKFFAALWVSLKRVVLGVAVNLVLMIITAYPLSKSKEKLAGRGFYAVFFIITMLINGGLIPTYLVVVKMGLKDSLWSLILPGGASGVQHDHFDELYARASGRDRGSGNDRRGRSVPDSCADHSSGLEAGIGDSGTVLHGDALE